MTVGCGKLRNEELHISNTSPYVITTTKSRRMRRTECVESEENKSIKDFGGKGRRK